VALDFETVEASGLVKLYGPTRALAGVDVRLQAGQITSIEGDNGSGKSTLLSVLSLLTRPSRGEIRFGKHDARRKISLRGRVGILAHAPMVYPDLSALENLALTAELYGLGDVDEQVRAAAERFELGRFAQRPTRTYSRGQLQRVALARAILPKPRLLLLDEPSTGLDDAGRRRLVDAVTQEKARGAIVAIVTHDASLADELADAKMRLRAGRVVEPS